MIFGDFIQTQLKLFACNGTEKLLNQNFPLFNRCRWWETRKINKVEIFIGVGFRSCALFFLQKNIENFFTWQRKFALRLESCEQLWDRKIANYCKIFVGDLHSFIFFCNDHWTPCNSNLLVEALVSKVVYCIGIRLYPRQQHFGVVFPWTRFPLIVKPLTVDKVHQAHPLLSRHGDLLTTTISGHNSRSV